jgi:hypothetical protein
MREYRQQRHKERETLAVFSGCMPNCTMWIPERTVTARQWAYNELVDVGYLETVADDGFNPGKKGFQVSSTGEIVLNMLANLMGSYLALQVDLDGDL